jgi:demethylmenaquinone methyltransferase/2-methoxy-6-polyprenyl-1,4-benzoquinol methylase
MKSTTGDINAAYDRTAPMYDIINALYFAGRDRQYRSHLIDRLDLQSDDRVLDLCCGTGLDFLYIRQRVAERGIVIGVDASSQMIRRAQRRVTRQAVHLIRADIAHLPFQDRIFNAVVVSFCLTITPTYTTSVDEADRVLATAGRIGVLANNQPPGRLKNVLVKLVSLMAKIDYTRDVIGQLETTFSRIETRMTHGALVRSWIGMKRAEPTPTVVKRE